MEPLETLYALQDQLAEAFADRKIVFTVYQSQGQDDSPAASSQLFQLLQSSNTPIQEVWLNYLELGREPTSMAGLATALGKTRIENVFLCHNGIGDEGAEMIAEAIKTNQHLKELWLDGNQIGLSGAKALAKVVPGKACALEVLSMDDNPITNEGAGVLLEAARKADSLRYLSFSRSNFATKQEGEVIQKSMTRLTIKHKIWRTLLWPTGFLGRYLFGEYRFSGWSFSR